MAKKPKEVLPPTEGETTEHTVNAQDVANNPELAQEGIVEDDVVEIPAELEGPTNQVGDNGEEGVSGSDTAELNLGYGDSVKISTGEHGVVDGILADGKYRIKDLTGRELGVYPLGNLSKP